MLATRIIPALLTRGPTLVKGVAFDSWRSVGVTTQACRIHSMRGVDELVLLDISATREGRGPNLQLVETLSDSMFMPLSVGGGIKTLQHVKDLLHAGADKVVVCTGALDRPQLLGEIADSVGRQAAVVAIDYRYVRDPVTNQPTAKVTSRCGTTMIVFPQMGLPDPVVWAISAEQHGAGEILLTCIDREGAMTGYDLEMLRQVAEAVSIPVIAHAGAGTYAHLADAVHYGASAVAAGAMYQFTDQTPRGAAEYLAAQGIEVRL